MKKGTVRGYDLNLRQFCLYVRNCDIDKVRLEDVTSWFSLLDVLHWQRNSFIPKAQALRKLFEFYKMQGFTVLEPELIPLPSREYNIPRVATQENYRKLLSTIPVERNDPRHLRNKAIIMLLWDTGARNSELLSLDEHDVDTVQMRAVIKTEKSKGRRPFREIFWTEETNKALLTWLAKRDYLKKTKMPHMDECLFPCICSSGNLNLTGKRITNKGVAEFLRRYSNRAKIPYMNAHSFRHHMGHDIISQGGSSSDVMNILGHATLASSSIYTMMTGKELEDRYNIFKRRSSES
ncbi:MAG: tyrosine-type recombinase/integrase [Crocinitomicaceae bacterium]|nr:tyrosine-type recombinase/integrase [Crocinitomicaceae bacterium]